MSLRDQLKADVSAAMRSGETLRRDTLRMALSSLALVEKELKRDATDDEVLARGLDCQRDLAVHRAHRGLEGPVRRVGAHADEPHHGAARGA